MLREKLDKLQEYMRRETGIDDIELVNIPLGVLPVGNRNIDNYFMEKKREVLFLLKENPKYFGCHDNIYCQSCIPCLCLVLDNEVSEDPYGASILSQPVHYGRTREFITFRKGTTKSCLKRYGTSKKIKEWLTCGISVTKILTSNDIYIKDNLENKKEMNLGNKILSVYKYNDNFNIEKNEEEGVFNIIYKDENDVSSPILSYKDNTLFKSELKEEILHILARVMNIEEN